MNTLILQYISKNMRHREN